LKYTARQLAPNVLEVLIKDFKAGCKQEFLLHSDEHIDNSHADIALMQKHDAEAGARGAGIFSFGDFSCLMQGKWDKRADVNQLREELRTGNYLDSVVVHNAGTIKKNASNYVMMSPGNHEDSVLKRHETDICQHIIDRVQLDTGHKIYKGTYCGWILFKFQGAKSMSCTIPMFYHHGWGGGGPVTKGVIQSSRMTNYADAEIFYSGHTHDEWIFNNMRTAVSQNGKPYNYRQWCLRAPGYKDEFSSNEGWHITTGKGPKPKGAMWLKFAYDDSGKNDEKRRFVSINAELAI
jgi:hypothetical protein